MDKSFGGRMFPVFTMATLGGMFAILVAQNAGVIEGRIHPVMGPLEIHSPQPFPPPDYRTKWQGSAEKLRDCRFVRLEWFLGPRGDNRVMIPVEFTDKPEVRGQGILTWAGIVTGLEADRVRSNSHADVIHKCPNRPWETRTPFYDPPQEGEG